MTRLALVKWGWRSVGAAIAVGALFVLWTATGLTREHYDLAAGGVRFTRGTPPTITVLPTVPNDARVCLEQEQETRCMTITAMREWLLAHGTLARNGGMH